MLMSGTTMIVDRASIITFGGELMRSLTRLTMGRTELIVGEL